jgi:hypothetical protein
VKVIGAEVNRSKTMLQGKIGMGAGGCATAHTGKKSSNTSTDNDFLMELPHIFSG